MKENIGRLLVTGAVVGLMQSGVVVSVLGLSANASTTPKNLIAKASARHPSTTKYNAKGFVIAPYPRECAIKNCYNCPDFQYQEDAQAFFGAFPNDPSGLDGRPGAATEGRPNVACEARPHRPK
ncbi:hypothetical protein NDI44_26930 [Trichocoleus sp. DQ-A3]|uniref:hypothetical protein n=1 Tax=Cyanophyceae TaxID=3028117 RepID=UPI001682AC97|nr:hypothetical protein [Coleofasciculus sp. FACHB-125]MBD1903759.1 hypothetical protein [Coleofasciculus sp. FACHB-125]